MNKRFVVGNRSERAIIPVSLEECLPEDHLARFTWTVVERMDLRDLLDVYGSEAGGRPALDPKGLLAVILYGHATGKASSRELKTACREEIAFRFLCGGVLADHSTLARFRNRHGSHVAQIFGQALHLCAKSGLIHLGVVALDGTKIAANASMAANRTFETLARDLEEKAKAVKEAEAAGGSQTMPRILARMQDCLARLDEPKSRLEAEQATRAKTHDEHIQERETFWIKPCATWPPTRRCAA